jgi:hypothetical protein
MRTACVTIWQWIPVRTQTHRLYSRALEELTVIGKGSYDADTQTYFVR